MTVDEIKEKLEPFRDKNWGWWQEDKNTEYVEVTPNKHYLVIIGGKYVSLEGALPKSFILGPTPFEDIDKFITILPLVLE